MAVPFPIRVVSQRAVPKMAVSHKGRSQNCHSQLAMGVQNNWCFIPPTFWTLNIQSGHYVSHELFLLRKTIILNTATLGTAFMRYLDTATLGTAL